MEICSLFINVYKRGIVIAVTINVVSISFVAKKWLKIVRYRRDFVITVIAITELLGNNSIFKEMKKNMYQLLERILFCMTKTDNEKLLPSKGGFQLTENQSRGFK